MKRRAHGFDWDDFPVISGQGSLHDLSDSAPEPRLWFAKSVSKAGAVGLAKRETARPPIGFFTGKRK